MAGAVVASCSIAASSRGDQCGQSVNSAAAQSGASSSSAAIGIARVPAIATGTVDPFTRASASWKGSGMGGTASGAPLDQGGHGDSEHERPAVEDLVDPARQARELEADDPGL